MSYHISKKVNLAFEEAITRVTKQLKEEGFGVLTNIDMQQTLKNKLDVSIKPYTILGACNPRLAYHALQKEDKIGLMLPCNVLVTGIEDGKSEISAVDPVKSMQGIENKELHDTAEEVRQKLERVINGL